VAPHTPAWCMIADSELWPLVRRIWLYRPSGLPGRTRDVELLLRFEFGVHRTVCSSLDD
jgi:hypothetical protein